MRPNSNSYLPMCMNLNSQPPKLLKNAFRIELMKFNLINVLLLILKIYLYEIVFE